MASNEGFTTVNNHGRKNLKQTLNRSSNSRMSRVVVKTTQTRRKSSRTLLLKEVGNKEFKYDGLQTVDRSPQGNVFLVFDTLENSRKAFKDLRVNKVNCKYSYYKLFFKSSNLDTTKSYDELKGSFLSVLDGNVSGVNVLYFKYYKRDGKFTGSGDFVVDRKVDCDSFVTSRTLKFSDTNDVTFYRFRTNRGAPKEDGDVKEGNNSEEEVVDQ
jgi:hypothetical protein